MLTFTDGNCIIYSFWTVATFSVLSTTLSEHFEGLGKGSSGVTDAKVSETFISLNSLLRSRYYFFVNSILFLDKTVSMCINIHRNHSR